MARKKPLPKYQDVGQTEEELAFINDSLAIDTNATNALQFFDKYNISNDDPNYDITGDIRISDAEIEDYNRGKAIMLDAAKRRATDVDFWNRMNPPPTVRRQKNAIRKEGGEILDSFKSAARFDQKSYKKNPGRRNKG